MLEICVKKNAIRYNVVSWILQVMQMRIGAGATAHYGSGSAAQIKWSLSQRLRLYNTNISYKKNWSADTVYFKSENKLPVSSL
jgi:hypothetical protein